MQSQRTARAIVVLMLAGWLAGLAPFAAAQDNSDAPTIERRSYSISEDKAMALVDLFTFNDIQVRVVASARGISVQGTPAELRVLEAVVELLERYKDRDVSDTGAFIGEMRSNWTTTGAYSLPEDKAAHLFRLLAFDDVPVLVSRSGGGVTVQASEADQKIVGGLVQMLSGVRLRGSADVTGETKLADPSKPSVEKRAAKDDRRERRQRSDRARRPRRPAPPAPPASEVHDAEYYKSELAHMDQCQKLIDRIHRLQGTRRELERKSLQIQQQLEALGEDLEKLSNELDKAEVRLNLHLQGEYHKKAESPQ